MIITNTHQWTRRTDRQTHIHIYRKRKQSAFMFIPPPPSQTCGPEAEKTAWHLLAWSERKTAETRKEFTKVPHSSNRIQVKWSFLLVLILCPCVKSGKCESGIQTAVKNGYIQKRMWSGFLFIVSPSSSNTWSDYASEGGGRRESRKGEQEL